MKAVNIKWDVTDGAEEMTQEEIKDILAELPTEVKIPEGIDEDEVEDWLSDEYGYCHYGFDLEDGV